MLPIRSLSRNVYGATLTATSLRRTESRIYGSISAWEVTVGSLQEVYPISQPQSAQGFQKEPGMSSSHRIWNCCCVTREWFSIFFFQHSSADWAGQLAQHSLLCVAFLCSSRVHVMPALHASRCCMEIFSPKMWDVVLLSQLSQWGGLSWDYLHSDFSLKTIAKKYRLYPLRTDRSSVTFLEFFSRMARIETSWK